MKQTCGLLVLLLGWGVWSANAEPQGDKKLIARGSKVYAKHCVQCHGPGGDGKGFEAALQKLGARDFTQGVLKYRSTAPGELPTSEDLYRTVTQGVARTPMPHHALLKEKDGRAVVEYVQTFFPALEVARQAQPLPKVPRPKNAGSPTSLARGREVYELLQCGSCHGPAGRGEGPQTAALPPDTLGNAQFPADLTRGKFKSGPGVDDLYRVLMTGLDGTSLSAYGRLFTEPGETGVQERDVWNLVFYILQLRRAGAFSAAGP